MKAYRCDKDGCTRAYNSSQSYFDIVNDRLVRQEKDQEDCHSCELPMYLDAVNPDGTGIWRCAQIHCDYSLQVPSAKRSAD
jgi:ribosomal protein L37AE/L43A